MQCPHNIARPMMPKLKTTVLPASGRVISRPMLRECRRLERWKSVCFNQISVCLPGFLFLTFPRAFPCDLLWPLFFQNQSIFFLIHSLKKTSVHVPNKDEIPFFLYGIPSGFFTPASRTGIGQIEKRSRKITSRTVIGPAGDR